MLKWIVANKDLLFSGLGVAVGSWLLRTIFSGPAEPKNRMSSRINADHITGPMAIGNQVMQTLSIHHHGADLSDNLASDVEAESGPSLQRIYTDVGRASLYIKSSIEQAYVGQPVVWNLALASMDTTGTSEGKLRVHARDVDDSSRISVFLTVDEATYPFLKLVEEGDQIRVAGRIARLKHNILDLEVTDLKLLSNEPSR